jgi:hypothetical protein
LFLPDKRASVIGHFWPPDDEQARRSVRASGGGGQESGGGSRGTGGSGVGGETVPGSFSVTTRTKSAATQKPRDARCARRGVLCEKRSAIGRRPVAEL